MAELSKLQIRAKILSVLSEIKANNEYTVEKLDEYIKILSVIEDKNTFTDIILKEFVKLEESECDFCSLIIKQISDLKYLESKVFEVLQSNASDDTKYKLVQLLRIVGSKEDVSAIPQYFENPAEILDKETEKLLEKAVFNPETMLDFLDFIYTVNDRDKELLLLSLQNDYKSDNLVNILYPILYSDFPDDLKIKVTKIISESKSPLALAPLQYLLETSENDEIKSACALELKKLKLSGATEKKAKEYYKEILSDSSPAEFYTTIPDGAGNQAILISRMTKNSNLHFAAIVINDLIGVVDCFGFYNISEDETIRIITKFYQSEGKYKITPAYAKTRINDAVALTIKNKKAFPYEFICWNTLMMDVDPLSEDINTIINNADLNSSYSTEDVLNALTKEYTFRWYISKDDSASFKKLVEEIYNFQDFKDIKVINDEIKNYIDEIFDSNISQIWKNKIVQMIYLLIENGKKEDAAKFYKLLNDDTLFRLFKEVILQRSVFNNFVIIKESCKESVFSTNIFRKKSSKNSEYNVNKIDKIIELLKKNWING